MSPSAKKIALQPSALRVQVPPGLTINSPTTTPRHHWDDDEHLTNGRPRKRRRHVHLCPEYPLDGTCCPCSRHAYCSSDPCTDCECRRNEKRCTKNCACRRCRNQSLEPSTSDDGPLPAAHAADNSPTSPPQGDSPPHAKPVCQTSCCGDQNSPSDALMRVRDGADPRVAPLPDNDDEAPAGTTADRGGKEQATAGDRSTYFFGSDSDGAADAAGGGRDAGRGAGRDAGNNVGDGGGAGASRGTETSTTSGVGTPPPASSGGGGSAPYEAANAAGDRRGGGSGAGSDAGNNTGDSGGACGSRGARTNTAPGGGKNSSTKKGGRNDAAARKNAANNNADAESGDGTTTGSGEGNTLETAGAPAPPPAPAQAQLLRLAHTLPAWTTSPMLCRDKSDDNEPAARPGGRGCRPPTRGQREDADGPADLRQ